MFIKQTSVFIENRNGAIMEITDVLRRADVNMRALSIADTIDFGVVRLIADKPEIALEALRREKLTVVETDVIALSVDDTPGGFHIALEALYYGEVMIEYSYAFVAPLGGGATVILKCREPEKAVALLKASGVKILSQDEIH